MNRKNYGEIIGHTSNDATVTESYYIANNENNYRVGTNKSRRRYRRTKKINSKNRSESKDF